MIKYSFLISAALLLVAAAAAPAQSVRAGIEAWQKGQPEVAVAIWAPLAAKGDDDAAFNLGQAYRLGKGVPLNLPRAHHYLEQAARKGHVDGAATLGILLFQNGNRTGALRWIKLAADGGEPRSLLLYGVALYNGDGVAPDPVGGYAYVSRAAAQGSASAKETLAEMDAAMPREQRLKGLQLAKSMVAARQVAPSQAKASAIEKIAKPVAVPVETRVARTALRESSGWRIQLGAFGQRASAEALFARLGSKIGPQQDYYVTAGKVIRLQVGPYAHRAEAAAACARLKPQPCFPVETR